MLSIIPTILFTLISCFYIIPNAKKSIYLEKDIQIRYNVENAYSIVGYYYSLAEKGVMPVAAAQATAKETISKMRYGQDGYFWIDNTNFVNLMHGTRPETVGENRKETKDVKGTYMVKEYIEGAIQHKAEGYFSDFWFPKPNETEASPKRGYAKFFEPWGWIVATGIYIDDVEKTVSNQVYTLVVINIALIIATVLLTYWFSKKSIVSPLQNVISKLGDMANSGGDLTQKLEVSSKDELGQLASVVNTMTENLRQLIRRIAQSSEQVASAAELLTANSEQSAQAANQVAASIAQTAQGADKQSNAVADALILVKEIASSAQQGAAEAGNAVAITKQAVNVALDGNKAVESAIRQMNQIQVTVDNSAQAIAQLGEQSTQIGKIVDVISSIAGQTNLLALNAAIEAARAGEQGRGFAVVAEEVRKLAEESQQATQQITTLIGQIQSSTAIAVDAMSYGTTEVKKGTEVVNKAGGAFNDIASQVNDVAQIAKGAADVLSKLADSSGQVLSTVQQVDAVSKDIASQAQNISAATQEQSATTEEISASKAYLASATIPRSGSNIFPISLGSTLI